MNFVHTFSAADLLFISFQTVSSICASMQKHKAQQVCHLRVLRSRTLYATVAHKRIRLRPEHATGVCKCEFYG